MRTHPDRRSGLIGPAGLALVAIVLSGVVVAGPVLAGTGAIADGAKHGKPRLTLINGEPATVHGAGFQPRSHVRVTLRTSATATRRPLTGPHGGFTAHFSAVIDRCTSWSVSASQHGQTVFLRSGPKPGCAPAGAP